MMLTKNTIKFTKVYPKLWGQSEATLLKVDLISFSDIGKDLIEYDTRADDGSYYDLPKEKLLHLTFLGDKRIPFCTIRRWTEQKELYYRNKIGQQFTLDITGRHWFGKTGAP